MIHHSGISTYSASNESFGTSITTTPQTFTADCFEIGSDKPSLPVLYLKIQK